MEISVEILPQTPKNPLTMLGEYAGIAYNSPTDNAARNKKRGLECISSGHMRMLEFLDVFMKVDGISARTVRQWFRHVGDGLTAVQRSTRYVKEKDFDYYIPPAIQKKEEALDIYVRQMTDIQESYNSLLSLGIKQEDAAGILPLNMETATVIKKNARNLHDMMKVRLCNRSYVEIRELMKAICKALSEYSEEWAELVPIIFKAQCDILGYCPETYSCGKYPPKN